MNNFLKSVGCFLPEWWNQMSASCALPKPSFPMMEKDDFSTSLMFTSPPHSFLTMMFLAFLSNKASFETVIKSFYHFIIKMKKYFAQKNDRIELEFKKIKEEILTRLTFIS